MLQACFARLTAFCIRYAPLTLLVAVLVVASSAVYVARHFSINTNINTLLSAKLPWHQRDEAYMAAFPQQADSILAVINAPTPEFAGAAAANLAGYLAQQKGQFRSIDASQTSEFFSRAALLYLSQEDVASRMQKLGQAAPLIRILATDQSLRGLAHALSLSLGGLQTGHYALDDLARPLNTIADSLDQVLAGKPATFSWQVLVNNAPAKPADLMSLINIWPELDYSSIEPGQKATEAVHRAVDDSKIGPTYDATLRLTGTVALADLQFSTLHEGVALNFAVTGLIIIVVLWLALRSIRIVVAVSICIFVGLLATAALGLLLAGSFNPISVAFAVLFVGLGADFAIQYSVRYRAQRHELHDLKPSLIGAARLVGAPLMLAALAASAGFLSFVPTDYRGVAELGLIAGVGMVVAYIVSLTLLPVLLWYFAPAGEPEPLGYAALAGADRFLHHHRIFIVVGTSLVALAGLPFLFHLQFNFDPNSLQNPDSEAIVALRMLNDNPNVIVNSADVLTAPKDAPAVVKRVSALPEVASTRNLNSFVPTDQEAKIKLVAAASAMIDPALTAAKSPPSSDSDDVAALRTTAKDLQDTAGEGAGAGASAANRLAKDINRLADGDGQTRQKAAATFITPLQINLQQLSLSLHPQQVTRANLPADLVGQWMTKNGQMRTQIVPKGDANDSNTLQRFAEAVLRVEPDATGVAIQTYEWGRTVTDAFLKAGLLALCSIAILLWLVLRRIGDMLLTLIPLLVAAAVTLEICGLTGFQINYANIIALPALLGVGVAFKIYYVMAWRAGEANFLESVLTRAVFFSAVMTATSFGSLWFSSNPGISSMGKLLALSLACTLASAALFQPALMGPPRKKIALPA
jgi:uncharacterized protein